MITAPSPPLTQSRHWRILAAALAIASASTAGHAAINSPGDIPGLILWLDADQGVTESGGSVSQWDDLSGNGNHVSQATDVWRPTLVTAATSNGSPAISFDRAAATAGGRDNDNDFLSSSALQLDNTMTAFFVLSPDSLPVGSGERFAGHYSDGQFRFNNGNASMWISGNADGPAATAAQFQTLAYRLDGTVEVSIDGSPFATAAASSTVAASDFLVGGVANTFVSGGAYGSFDGDIAGVIIYDAVLSDTQVADVLDYIDYAFFSGTPEPFEITDIRCEKVTDPEENIVVTITFNSRPGRLYSLLFTSDLSTPVLDRSDLDDMIVGASGETSTTVTVDFNADQIPLDTSPLFFVLKEN